MTANTSFDNATASFKAPPAAVLADSPPAAATRRVWVDRPQVFSPNRVQPVRHNLHQHPLMQLPAITALAKRLSATKQCRFIVPTMNQAEEFHHSSQDSQGRAIDEVMRRIDEPGSWLALYNIETDPVYKAFLDEVIDSARPLVEPQQPGIFNVAGYFFISAPPSVTPFHIDSENNFLLQLHGRKTINVWGHDDRHVLPPELAEQFIVYRSLDKVRLQDGFRERSHTFDVGPGQGVYFPNTSPHMTRCDTDWVREGDGVSISIAVVFYSDVTRRSANVHVWNILLRRLGLTPRPPGELEWLDRLKYPFGRALVWFKTRYRGYKPRKGILRS